GDPLLGWDTDQFPWSVQDSAMAFVEVIRAGGLGAGGCNFDAKIRRQSIEPADLVHAHVGGIDHIARAFLVAARIVEDGRLEAERERRYAGWQEPDAAAMLAGTGTLDEIAAQAIERDVDPQPRSGGQERLENLVSRFF
ncbi:MAG: xylose isomerase, partial [Gluconacetobacter diazotrophicus]|nr:xylose isomerase [Gluconacetobacter diazotrophicus]